MLAFSPLFATFENHELVHRHPPVMTKLSKTLLPLPHTIHKS